MFKSEFRVPRNCQKTIDKYPQKNFFFETKPRTQNDEDFRGDFPRRRHRDLVPKPQGSASGPFRVVRAKIFERIFEWMQDPKTYRQIESEGLKDAKAQI